MELIVLLESLKKLYQALEETKRADLMKLAADAQLEAIQVTQDNVQLRAEILELREVFRWTGSLVFDGSVFWEETDAGKVGPYCPKCWQVDKKPIRLTTYFPDYFGKCPGCENAFPKPEKYRYPGESGSPPGPSLRFRQRPRI